MNHKLYQLVLLMALDQYMAILSGTWWYCMLLSSAGSAEAFYACIYKKKTGIWSVVNDASYIHTLTDNRL